MSRKRKLLSISERCRICLVEHGCMSNLFDESVQSKLDDLSKCTSINIKDENGLPDIICHACLYKLDIWNEFKEQFIRSNQMLLSQLEIVETSNDKNSELKKAHGDLDQSGENSLSDASDKKKSKSEVPPLIPLDFANKDSVVDQIMLNEMYVSEDDVTSSKDSSQRAHDKDNVEAKSSQVLSKVKIFMARRNRTLEQRKASTQRWVERKKALLAATGESVSDTDSMTSDDIQLTPVQKARAKTNLDKETEKQKRLARALKNLEIDMVDNCSIKNKNGFMSVDTDSDTRRTRSFKDVNSDASCKNNSLKGEVKNDSKEKENSPRVMSLKIGEIEIAEDSFKSSSLKSELKIGGTTYIVTSTLTESHYLNKANLNSLLKECKNGSSEQNLREKNTDIIDAVQLRRINPIPTDSTDKKCIERCLNIEIEGTEIEVLKRVQVELADFVKKEMKQRLIGTNIDKKTRNICQNSHNTLDQQLKSIVEKTIKKNFESSVMRSCDAPQTPGRVSPTFIQEVMNSQKYQPKVVLKRLDIMKESKLRNINNMHLAIKRTVKGKLGGPFSMVSHKRQSVPPIRYNDYNTSPLDSDSNLSEETGTSGIENNHNVQKSQNSNVAKHIEQLNEQRMDRQENVCKINSSSSEKHVCGVCQESFNNYNDAATHIRTHKTDTISKSNKHKMMRCKRCHEIVEARFVKAHICKSTKHVHKCYVCNSTFRTEKLLVRHLENHDQSEFNIENITKGDSQKLNALNSKSKNQVSKEENNIKLDKGLKEDAMSESERPKKTYTCFVCDKIFTDEEILKDHLQKHCDDMSEGDQSPGKEQYQCAICGDSLDSEDALEAHVEKHLFDEEDDNPNLINIANENEKSKDEIYQCVQCSETFNSEMLLEMHMQAHEEEVAIAEWEKQGIKTYEFQCVICDELLETEEDLTEHLNIHNSDGHVCQLCDKPFSSLEDLQNHVATH